VDAYSANAPSQVPNTSSPARNRVMVLDGAGIRLLVAEPLPPAPAACCI
jgi:hypothetical protein